MAEVIKPIEENGKHKLEVRLPELGERITHEFGDGDEAWRQYRLLRRFYGEDNIE